MERKHGAIAQWLERSPSKREVEGSIPSSALFFVHCPISGSLLGHKQPVHMLSIMTQYWIRPYSGEYTSSRLIWEVKHQQAWIVLAWVTSWEVRVLESFLLFFTEAESCSGLLTQDQKRENVGICVIWVLPNPLWGRTIWLEHQKCPNWGGQNDRFYLLFRNSPTGQKCENVGKTGYLDAPEAIMRSEPQIGASHMVLITYSQWNTVHMEFSDFPPDTPQ